ncbi:MAG: tetratricopeptide repeat protein [Actinobacteria bacterium]|nr:tetratricopeptide repeat protein [Actinomycetota bacterium]
MIATHLLDAYRAEPNDSDAGEIKADTRGWLVRAGERAAALAATDDAQRSFEAAVDLADEPLERARLLERAGELARAADRIDIAEQHLRAALLLCDEVGATHDRARVAAALGLALWRQGSIVEAVDLLEEAFAVLVGDEQDADFATLAAQLGRLHYFAGNGQLAAERIEVALDIGEELKLPAVLSSALNTKSLTVQHHPHEADALIRQALRVALDHDLVFEALRAYNNLFVQLANRDRLEESEPLLEEAMTLARRRGDRFWEVRLAAYLCDLHLYHGRWDEARELAGTLPLDRSAGEPVLGNTVLRLARIAIDRDERVRASELLDLFPHETDAVDRQRLGVALGRRQLEAQLDGRIGDASASIVERLPLAIEFLEADTIGEQLLDAANYARETGDHTSALQAAALIDVLPPNVHTRMVDSQLYRLHANAAAAQGEEAAAADAFAVALANARNLDFAFFLAPVLYDYGAWLASSGRPEEAAPLLAEARELFAGMGATVWLRRLDTLAPAATRV